MRFPVVAKLGQHFLAQSTERKLLMLGGLYYTPAAILFPIVTHYQLKKNPDLSPYDRKLLMGMTVVRQVVGAALSYIGYYGSIALTGKAFKMKSNTLGQFGVAVAVTTFLDGFLKAWITNNPKLLKWVFKGNDLARLSELKGNPLKSSSVKTGEASRSSSLPLDLRATIQSSPRPKLNHGLSQFTGIHSLSGVVSAPGLFSPVAPARTNNPFQGKAWLIPSQAAQQ